MSLGTNSNQNREEILHVHPTNPPLFPDRREKKKRNYLRRGVVGIGSSINITFCRRGVGRTT